MITYILKDAHRKVLNIILKEIDSNIKNGIQIGESIQLKMKINEIIEAGKYKHTDVDLLNALVEEHKKSY